MKKSKQSIAWWMFLFVIVGLGAVWLIRADIVFNENAVGMRAYHTGLDQGSYSAIGTPLLFGWEAPVWMPKYLEAGRTFKVVGPIRNLSGDGLVVDARILLDYEKNYRYAQSSNPTTPWIVGETYRIWYADIHGHKILEYQSR